MRRLPAVTLVACIAASLTPLANAGVAAADTRSAVNLIANPGFAADPPLSRWTCDDRVGTDTLIPGVEFLQVGPRDDVEPPAAVRAAAGYVPPGMTIPPDATRLVGTPSASKRAVCSQVVPVRPRSTYTLSVTVYRGVVVLGSDYGAVRGRGSEDAATTVRTTFTTTATADRIRVYVQGDLGGEGYELDDVVLTGPDSTRRVPALPAGLTWHPYTSRALMLEWTGSPGATGYRVYRDGKLVGATTGTWLPVLGLTAGRTYRFAVEALNAAGRSARATIATQSAPIYAEPPPAPEPGAVEFDGPGNVLLGWSSQSTTDGHLVYLDGRLLGWVPGDFGLIPRPAPGTYTIEVTSLNSAGESARSSPVTVTV